MFLVVLFPACAGPSRYTPSDGSGTRTKGGDEELTGIESFADLDGILAKRLEVLEAGARGLERSLTSQYREQFLDGVMPNLRRMHGIAQTWAAEVATMKDGPERETKLRRTGVRYEAVWILSEVLQLEMAMMRMSDWADAAGQASNQIVAQLGAFQADFAGLVKAAEELQSERMVAEVHQCLPRFQQWIEFMDGWRTALERGQRWSGNGQLAADLLMLAGAAFRLRLPGVGNGLAAIASIGSGGATAARISVAELAQLLEAIRQLIAIGALDSRVVMGVSALGSRLAGVVENPGSGAFATETIQGRLPHRTPPRIEGGNLSEGWRHIEAHQGAPHC